MSSSSSDSDLSEEEQTRARHRFEMLRPHLEGGIPLTRIVEQYGLILRTAQRWIQRYRRHGWVGLARKPRNDKGKRRALPQLLQERITALALENPILSVADIYREAKNIAKVNEWSEPKYSTVYDIVHRVRDHTEN